MWLFATMSALFVAAVLAMHLVPRGMKLRVTKPRSLILIKMALDAVVTCMLLLYWWWDPIHRHEF